MARMSAAERRAILIDAAIAVMSREGVPHTTTRAIVAEADMQIGVFHYCFRSKEELILEVMKEISHRSSVAVESAISAGSDPAEIIKSAVDAYWHHIESHPLEHLLSYELTSYALRQPGNEVAAVAQYDYYFHAMAEVLAKAAEAGGFTWRTSIDVLVPTVLAMIEGVTFQWLVCKDADKARAVLDQLVTHLLRDAGVEDAALEGLA